MRIQIKQFRIFGSVCLMLVLLGGCSTPGTTEATTPTMPERVNSEPVIESTASPEFTSSPTRTPVMTGLATRFARIDLTATQKAGDLKKTLDVTPSPTIPVLEPGMTPSIAGTPLPGAAPIRAENLDRLVNAARWGKGVINLVAFSPDGLTFAVGSGFGVAVYSMQNLNNPPRWIAFKEPLAYEEMSFSKDGKFLRLNLTGASWYIDIEHQQIMGTMPTEDWAPDLHIHKRSNGYDGISIVSPDETLELQLDLNFASDSNREVVLGDVVDNKTDQPLFKFHDETMYVQYADYNRPEGCDIVSSGHCGNAFDPLVMAPFQAGFSSSNQSFAVLYRPPDLFNNQGYSKLRVYAGKDGSLIDTIGSFDIPVADFAYQPNSETLLIAYTGGSIQLWNIPQKKIVYQATNFNPETYFFTLSNDGRYAFLLQPGMLEVRRTSDGVVLSQYEAEAFAVSPVDNRVAVGNKAGDIQVEDLDHLKTVSHMKGHTARIYALAFSPDGSQLTSSSEDCTVRNWDANTGQFLNYYEQAKVNTGDVGESRIFVTYLDYLPGSNGLMGFGSWGTAVKWNLNSGVKSFVTGSEPLASYDGMVSTVKPHFPEYFWIEAEQNRFYIDGNAYDLGTGKLAGNYVPDPNQPTECSSAGPVTKDGKIIFSRGYGDLNGQICVQDAKTKELIRTIRVVSQEFVCAADIEYPFLSPDGKQLLVPFVDGTVYIYQIPAE